MRENEITGMSALESALQAAAESKPYFMLTCDGKVTYLAGPGADRYEARVNRFYEDQFGITQVDILQVDHEVSLGSRKSPAAALRLLVKVADADYVTRMKQ